MSPAFSPERWWARHNDGMTALALCGVIGELLDRRARARWWWRPFLTRKIRRLEARRDAALRACWEA